MSAESVDKILEVTPPMGINDVLAYEESGNQEEDEKTLLVPEAFTSNLTYWLEDIKADKRSEIERFPYSIGRSSQNDLQLKSRQISRKHAEISKVEGGVAIENLSSLNGVFVNAIKVSRVLLQDGDLIEIGGTRLRYRAVEGGSQDQKEKLDEQLPAKSLSTQKKWNKASTRKLVFFSSVLFILLIAGYLMYMRFLDSRIMYVKENAGPVNNQSMVKVAVNEQEKIGRNSQVERKNSVINQSQIVPVKVQPIEKSHAERKPKIEKPVRLKTGVSEIRKMRMTYLEGDYIGAKSHLEKVIADRKYSAQGRDMAAGLLNDINKLNMLYSKGKHAYEKGNKSLAFKQWLEFLGKEKTIFPGEKSRFAVEVENMVASEYEQMGSIAYQGERWHDAYHHWMNAIRINPRSRVKESLASLEANARDVYREAYRLETVNLERAKALWEKVLMLVPRESEYHIKAAAKLEWYAHLQNSRE